MASARKKLDEKNLKTLRELVSLPHNKYCFDCNQRGPTYVNVTIGSFVCTKCSGMLRGLTPPHRVKSISMATFTQEEVELVQQRGNEHCRRTWLGLYEGQPLTDGSPRDEQHVHDLMVEKYERRRYYVEPATAATLSNGSQHQLLLQQQQQQRAKQLTAISLASEPKPIRLNGMVAEKNEKNLLPSRPNGISRPTVINGTVTSNNKGLSLSAPGKQEFVANFEQADIFNASNNNNVGGGKHETFTNPQMGILNGTGQQASFANFENNPVFSTPSKDAFSIFDLQFCSNSGPMLNHVPLFPKCNVNRWSMPELPNTKNQHKNNPLLPPAPPEDRYLPLKDLDNALKNQPTIDWNSGSSNGSGYNSSTPSGSMYSSSSPQSMYGSPSQGQFAAVFPQEPAPVSNPFNTNGQNAWGTTTTNGFTNGTGANPFRPVVDPFKMNGFSQNFQPTFATQFNGPTWTPNPFKVATNGLSNNPFL